MTYDAGVTRRGDRRADAIGEEALPYGYAMSRIVALACMLPVAPMQAAPPPASHGMCVVDRDARQLPVCALETYQGGIRVAARYLRQLSGNRHGALVAVVVPGSGWSYVDRRGGLVVRHVAIMDNGASAFHHGLVRVNDRDKWGLADRRGRLVVPLRYDGMLDYRPGEGWKACTGCRTRSDGEHSGFEGGAWVSLDRHGKPQTSTRGS